MGKRGKVPDSRQIPAGVEGGAQVAGYEGPRPPDILKEAQEAVWWMEPDDRDQTKEQYRLAIIDELKEALR